MDGAERIAAERKRQIEEENWTAKHDDTHQKGEMALAAALYATPILLKQEVKGGTGHWNETRFVDPWPWSHTWDKRPRDGNVLHPNGIYLNPQLGTSRDLTNPNPPSAEAITERQRQVEKAGALCAAEIDRLERLKNGTNEPPPPPPAESIAAPSQGTVGLGMARTNQISTSGRIVADGPSPDPEPLPDGQHRGYWALSEEERAKGFVRPVRLSYRHVGRPAPATTLRPLDEREKTLYEGEFAMFEEYPGGGGRFWTHEEISSIGKGCGTDTRMPRDCAETYARDPKFYGSTFCYRCKQHLPVGKDGEFVWLDQNGQVTEERVGT